MVCNRHCGHVHSNKLGNYPDDHNKGYDWQVPTMERRKETEEA